jgi:hypothetical protein
VCSGKKCNSQKFLFGLVIYGQSAGLVLRMREPTFGAPQPPAGCVPAELEQRLGLFQSLLFSGEDSGMSAPGWVFAESGAEAGEGMAQGSFGDNAH